MAKSYYDVLGVARSATQDEIKKAFRKKARTAHPDAGGSEEEFKELNEAYDVLSDDEKRKQYDMFGSVGGGAGGYGGGNPFGGNPFGGANPFGGGFRYSSSAPDGWAEIFDSIRNGEGAWGSGWEMPQRPTKGKDLTVSLPVTFDEAFNGVKKKITVRIPSTGERETVEAKVPAGANDGAKLRFKGKGELSRNGGERGDLLVTINVAPHELFGRNGADVTLEVPIDIAEAALGADVVIPTPDGTKIRIHVPAGTQDGGHLRVSGKGAPRPNQGGNGALDITLRVVVPSGMSETERELLTSYLKAKTQTPRSTLEAYMKK